MQRNTLAVVAMAALLALSGCSSMLSLGDGAGTVNFYVSDQPGAIDDFEQLNVTVEEVTFVAADGNETTFDANGTVDLTELRGANASLVEQYEVADGNYTKVFLGVSEVNGTLADGSSADVKLPSDKLRLNNNFTVGDGEEVDFVYDITVVARGNSGAYNIRPVASESGTDAPIDRVDDDEDGAKTALNAAFVGNVTAGENATVRVTANGSAVENATVTYDGEEYTTNADGEAVFPVPDNATEVEVTVTFEDAEADLEADLADPDDDANAAYEFAAAAV